MKTIIFLLLITSVFATSCGQKAKSQKTKFKIFSGNLVDAMATFPGGLLVLGRSLDDQQKFILPFTPGLELNLKKGSWEFATIGWMGALPIEGQTQCSHQVVQINSDAFTVNFNMTHQGCLMLSTLDGSRFTDPLYFYDQIGVNYGFKKLNVGTCTNLDNCSSQVNHYIRISLIHKIEGLTSNLPVSDLTSACVYSTGTNLTPPYGGVDGFLETSITTYVDSSCNIPIKTYKFEHGFGEILDQTLPVVSRGALSLNNNTLDTGPALSPFMGVYSDDLAVPSIGGLYYYNGTNDTTHYLDTSAILATAFTGNYIYFDGTNWITFADSSAVKLLLQD